MRMENDCYIISIEDYIKLFHNKLSFNDLSPIIK